MNKHCETTSVSLKSLAYQPQNFGVCKSALVPAQLMF